MLAIHTSLRTIIPPIFSDLFDTLHMQKLSEKANCETSSKLKKQQTIDLAAETETGAAKLLPVTQANMEEVAFGLTDKKKAKDKKEEQKAAQKNLRVGSRKQKRKANASSSLEKSQKTNPRMTPLPQSSPRTNDRNANRKSMSTNSAKIGNATWSNSTSM